MHYIEKDNQFVFVLSLLQVIPTEFVHVEEILNFTQFCFYSFIAPVILPSRHLTSDIGYILVATSYDQFPTSIGRHFLTSFGRLDWTSF